MKKHPNTLSGSDTPAIEMIESLRMKQGNIVVKVVPEKKNIVPDLRCHYYFLDPEAPIDGFGRAPVIVCVQTCILLEKK